MNEKFFVYDTVSVDSAKVSHYDHQLFGPVTVFKDVPIARTIVHQYPDGWAYKPADELEKTFWTAEGRWARLGGHPESTIVSSTEDVNGRIVNVRWTKSLKDLKTKRPMIRGILADLEVFDRKIAPEILEDMSNGKKTDVSIGFFFDKDETSGVIEDEDSPLRGEKYDYVQRNFFIDHLAFGLGRGEGRCPFPACGIGADRRSMGDPFAGYENFEACVEDVMKKNPSYTRKQAQGTCAIIEQRSKEKHKGDQPRTEAERAMAHFNLTEEEWEKLSDEEKEDYISRLPPRGTAGMKDKVDELKAKIVEALSGLDDLVEEEYQGNAAWITLSTRAKKFFSISDEDWAGLTEEEKLGYIAKLPPEKEVEGKTNKDTWSITKDEFYKLSLEKKILFLDLADCVECEDAWEVDPDLRWLGEDAQMSYAQKKALPDEVFAYIEPGCEKEDGKTAQRCRHMPLNDEEHVRAALAALGGARTGKVPSYAGKAKPKVCAAAKKFKIESEVCGTKGEKDISTDELLRKANEVLKKRKEIG